MQRIKISTISASTTKVENEEERKETRSRIDEERKVQIDVSQDALDTRRRSTYTSS